MDSPEQQNALATELKTLLVRTYSTALSSYSGQVIEFKRLRAASCLEKQLKRTCSI